MTIEVQEASVADLQTAMSAGETNSVELVEAYSARIAAFDRSGPGLNAVRVVNPDALTIAAALDEERRVHGARGPLHGIPVLVKDNYETREMTTTGGSLALADFATQRDAELVARLRAAGAVILGKTNMHEFAYGITTVGSLFGQTKNPYALGQHSGGSSGGTGAAIAASFAAVGMGSDTCGSIRIPSAYQNLVGLRGTQGLSSRFGIIPLSSTQDIGGPLARTTADLAAVLDATSGFDDKDQQTAESIGLMPQSFAALLAGEMSLANLRVGLVPELFSVAPEAASLNQVVQQAATRLEAAGAVVRETPWPDIEERLDDPAGGFLILLEDFKWDFDDFIASAPNHPISSLDELIAGGQCHPAVVPALMASASITARRNPLYLAALRDRTMLRREISAFMYNHDVDVLLYPSIRLPPLPLGEHQQGGSNCRLSAKSGLPAIALPAGFDVDGVPVGMELLGHAWSDGLLVQLAHAIEQFHSVRQPPKSVHPLT